MDQDKESTSGDGVAPNHVSGWSSSIYRWTRIRGLRSGGEGRNILSQQSYYGSKAMYVGILGSVAAIAVSALAEDKVRRYLLLGAVGLLCLFCFGLTEAI
jgi:hypothetical protein